MSLWLKLSIFSAHFSQKVTSRWVTQKSSLMLTWRTVLGHESMRPKLSDLPRLPSRGNSLGWNFSMATTGSAWVETRVATVQSSPPSPQALNWDWTSVPTNLQALSPQSLSVPSLIDILSKAISGERMKDVIYSDFFTTWRNLTFQFCILMFKI